MPYSQKQWQDRIKDAQGNIVQEGTPFSAGNMNRMEQGIADAHAQLEEAGRQKQTLIHGVSVLNGGVDAPVNIEIEGRTLIPMQNTVLDPLKYYVLADKRTKLKWADATIQAGIAKFTAKAERPTLIRVANFEGKAANSTLENPHETRALTTSTSLSTPAGITYVLTDAQLTLIKSLNGSAQTFQSVVNGVIPQQLFSFNLIEEVERQLGRIPRTTVADKVQWLKDNVSKLTCNWHGFGTGPNGGKENLSWWDFSTNGWILYFSDVKTAVTKIPAVPVVSKAIAADGFVHLLAHTDASDGTTASTINTDYVELEIEMKPEAILHAPRVPLYEVTQAHYDAINVTMLEDEVLRRYPSVEGVTHLQNPYIMAEGENLLPPFSEWTLHANAKVNGSYELELNATAAVQVSNYYVPVLPNQQYYFGAVEGNGHIKVQNHDINKAFLGVARNEVNNQAFTVTTPANCYFLNVMLFNVSGTGLFTFKNPMLTLGTTAKPFTPRNPSYALFETKLGSISGVADRLYEQDAKYFKRKMIEDVVLDGSLAWSAASDSAGYKKFIVSNLLASNATNSPYLLTKYNGVIANNYTYGDGAQVGSGNTTLYVNVLDTDTGFAETYTPTADEIKAYFNGWKVKTADPTTFKPTAWVSVVDGTDAPTQTLAYVAANKAANYTPYKLSYVLVAPKVEEIRSEGAISVNGLTQVEVGSGVIVREKVTPLAGSGANLNTIYINTDGSNPAHPNVSLKNQIERFVRIYRNGLIDNKWSINTGLAFGKVKAYVDQKDFDSTAEYTVSYLVLDKQKFTSNPVNVSTQFANNVRSALEDTTKKVEDNTTAISVNTNILYDVLKRLKAGGL